MIKEMFSIPNESPVDHCGRTLRRTLPKVCPVCRGVFYGYRFDDQVVEEFKMEAQDMVPSYTGWLKFRQTCGDSGCYLTEEQRWLSQSPAYKQAIENSNNKFAELNESRRESLREVKPRNTKPIKLLSLEDDDE